LPLSQPSRYVKWLGPLVIVFAGCAHEPEKAARPSRPSLGTEIFGVLCERVGAQALREDLSGASYRELCEGTSETVDSSKLPPAADEDVRARAVARIEALRRHRSSLIAALDGVFPDDTVVGKALDSADPKDSCEPRSHVPRRDQLRGLLTRLLPIEKETVPESSRALGRIVEPLASPDDRAAKRARLAMARLGARHGYVPAEYAAGLVGSFFSAPQLRDSVGSLTRLFSVDAKPFDAPGSRGTGYPALQSFLAAAKEELAAPAPALEPLTSSWDQASGRTIFSRPLSGFELARTVLLSEADGFSTEKPLYVARRDRRGLALPAKSGKPSAPFVDSDGDGLADVDNFGRFVIAPGVAPPKDPFIGDDQSHSFAYVDARKTTASMLLRHVAPLADPDGGREAVFSAIEGLSPMLRGPGKEALLDLVHAANQLAANRNMDSMLALGADLFRTQPALMARVAGNLLDAKATLDAHPEAALPAGSTLVDDILPTLLEMSEVPGLLEAVLAGLADDRAAFLRDALPPMLSFRDRLTYDRNALNGIPKNLTNGTGGAPDTPVDRTQPNTGFNRSLWQRFLQLIHDTRGVTICNKEGAVLHSIVSLDGGATYTEVPFPFKGGAQECALLKVENLALFYLRSTVGASKIHFRNELLTSMVSPDVMRRSTGLVGYWPSNVGEDVRPRPEFLNRLVFFDIFGDSPNVGDPNYLTNHTINDLQGPLLPTTACAPRSIVDPNVGEPDVAPDGKIHGLRTCQRGQHLSERNPDTIFGLEFNHGYEAMAPLVETFVKFGKEDLFLELLDVLHKHWSVQGGVANAEPALAKILASDLVPSLVELSKVLEARKVVRCGEDKGPACEAKSEVPAFTVLADGVRDVIDPAIAARVRLADRRGSTVNQRGRPITHLSLLREALERWDAALALDPTKSAKWAAARSRIVDEMVGVEGRGADSKWVDRATPALAGAVLDALRAQRLAECAGTTDCPRLRQEGTNGLAEVLDGKLLSPTLDLLDVVVRDEPARREIGRLVAYMMRQGSGLGGAAANPASRPFGTSQARAPGALDASLAALVDGLGGLGDLTEIRALYPMIAEALDDLDPLLALLSHLNARAYDGEGHEICSRELDPEEVVRSSLARLSVAVTPPGGPKQSALQIFIDAFADVNRASPAEKGPLAPGDYRSVFGNLHEVLTDPESGLEQLYASVKRATEN
jgi:hypothetical protein